MCFSFGRASVRLHGRDVVHRNSLAVGVNQSITQYVDYVSFFGLLQVAPVLRTVARALYGSRSVAVQSELFL